MAIAMVWGCGILNLLGVRPVGHASILLTVLLLAPFVGLVGAGIAVPAPLASSGGTARRAAPGRSAPWVRRWRS